MTTSKSAVLPGRRVRGSGTGRPVMALLDLLGRRWAMRILWEVSRQPLGFREIQRRCDQMSSSMLLARLEELRKAEFLDNSDGPWRLTDSGQQLLVALKPLYRFADLWAEGLGVVSGE